MIRISFSISSTWKGGEGDYKKAVAMYLRLPTYTSPAMEEGKKQHELISEYVKKYGKLPEFFDNTPLIKPVCEEKKEVMLTDDIQFVFIPDCWNVKTILEYKFTKDTEGISKYVASKQVESYAVGMAELGVEITKGEYLLADLVRKESARSIVWISPQTISETKQWLIEQASSFKDYLVQNNLLITKTNA